MFLICRLYRSLASAKNQAAVHACLHDVAEAHVHAIDPRELLTLSVRVEGRRTNLFKRVGRLLAEQPYARVFEQANYD